MPSPPGTSTALGSTRPCQPPPQCSAPLVALGDTPPPPPHHRAGSPAHRLHATQQGRQPGRHAGCLRARCVSGNATQGTWAVRHYTCPAVLLPAAAAADLQYPPYEAHWSMHTARRSSPPASSPVSFDQPHSCALHSMPKLSTPRSTACSTLRPLRVVQPTGCVPAGGERRSRRARAPAARALPQRCSRSGRCLALLRLRPNS